MLYSRIVPSVFYANLIDSFALFIDGLHFSVVHEDLFCAQPYCVIEKDGIRIMIFQDEQLATEHYPELRIETNDIETVFTSISASHPHLLHPNLNTVTLRPWGAREFALADHQVGIRIQQW